MKRLAIFLALALFALVPLGASAAASAPLAGDLDSSFGNGGVVTQGPGDAIAVQPDGTIVVGGGYTLARYLPDGSPDPSFGDGGSVALSGAYIRAVALQPDGKIVVAGTGGGSGGPEYVFSQFMVARYNSNGSPDTSFGTNGIVDTTIPEPGTPYQSSEATALAILPNGDILAAGIADVGGFPDNTYFALVQYKPDGSLDPSFGDDGITKTTFSGYDTLAAIASQPDGKIVASGNSWGGGHGDGSEQIALARYEPDGSLDPTFGKAGKVTTAKKLLYEGGPAALQDGKIVVAGSHVNNNGYGLFGVIARFGSGGHLDTTFGKHGYVDLSQIASPADVVTQSDQKILVLYSNSIVRLTPNGRIDKSFGTRGVVSLAGGIPAVAVALQTDGKILVSGASGSGTTLTRLIGGNNCVVPALRGKTVQTAKTALTRSYCTAGAISKVYSNKVARRRVVTTAPLLGDRLPGGSKVALVVSRGKRP